MQAGPESRSPNRENSARTVPSRVLRLRPTVAAVSGGCVEAAGVVRPRVPCSSACRPCGLSNSIEFDRIRSHDAWGAQVNFPPGASSSLGVFVNVPKEVRNSRKHARALRGSAGSPFSGVSMGPVLSRSLFLASFLLSAVSLTNGRSHGPIFRKIFIKNWDFWSSGVLGLMGNPS